MFCGPMISDTVDINVLLGHFNKKFFNSSTCLSSPHGSFICSAGIWGAWYHAGSWLIVGLGKRLLGGFLEDWLESEPKREEQ